MVKEFKEFAMKGNMMDMAIGIIIGAAFGKIVSSVVADVLMPPLGLLLGGVNFTGLKLTLREAVGNTAAVTLNYGAFLQTVVDFVIVAFAIFLMIRGINSMRKKQEAASLPPSSQEVLLAEIRDLLKARPLSAGSSR
ncbi:MAG: large-conductance mechanosensitive channel protein MscL [Acidobacteria bacterium]|nr:large-conductance mechanosensitive channel protein MscL [Acidobacteriota bacterium]MCI0722590.1 large-conductance mechanosensitive channel protein MscL [Acidobacteriota bacterium]